MRVLGDPGHPSWPKRGPQTPSARGEGRGLPGFVCVGCGKLRRFGGLARARMAWLDGGCARRGISPCHVAVRFLPGATWHAPALPAACKGGAPRPAALGIGRVMSARVRSLG